MIIPGPFRDFDLADHYSVGTFASLIPATDGPVPPGPNPPGPPGPRPIPTLKTKAFYGSADVTPATAKMRLVTIAEEIIAVLSSIQMQQ
jgi:hypothetical protein